MKSIISLIICVLITSCSNDNDDMVEQTLENYVQERIIEMGAVIACAASDNITGNVLTFFYPESGAKNIRLYETKSTDLDHNNFSNYNLVFLESNPFFNGYLGKYEQTMKDETWIIVTFELENVIKISNPIRSKQITKPTLWNDEVEIDISQLGMPNFKWEDNPVGDNAIYFQVISDSNNNLFSGTYTYENQFQYYKTENVVLNVTTQVPPDLISNTLYNFTLMDVSEDNWVNWVVQKSFEVQ
jgi:hypothetical protein